MTRGRRLITVQRLLGAEQEAPPRLPRHQRRLAKLRDRGTGDPLILLRTNMEAGHAGASGRFERLKEVALAYAFALKIAER